MIRGKKMRKPLRKLKIQEKAELEQELTPPDFVDFCQLKFCILIIN